MQEIREFKSYTDMCVAHKKDVDSFPMCFMFGNKSTKEIEDELERSLGTRSLDDVMTAPYGGLIRKTDINAYIEMFEHHDRERIHFNSSFNNLVDSIISEMNGHEYAYTQEPDDVLLALGKSEKDFQDECFAKAWQKAKKVVLACAE